MKIDNKINFPCIRFLTLTVLIMVMLNACKKVDDHYAVVVNTPYVVANYPSNLLVGDTLSISGKIFVDKGGYVTVGGVKANLAADNKQLNDDGSTIDNVKIVITKEMGIGSNIPVAVITLGTTVKLRSITIRQFIGVQQQTDTTLYVDQVATFQPENLSAYQSKNLYLLNNTSIDGNGNIWFDNAFGIFAVKNGQVTSVLKSGTVLQDNNSSFRIDRMLASVISYDGQTLTFSASVKDNADTLENYVYRLCQINLATKIVNTLNRTKEIINPLKPGIPGAFEGAIADINIVAMNLKTDVNNNVYFNNTYTPYTTGGYSYIINNVCGVTPVGKVTSYFSLKDPFSSSPPLFNVPGVPIAFTTDYKISPDGKFAYVFDKENFNYNFSILVYDIPNKQPLYSTGISSNFKFKSFDSSPLTGFPSSFAGIYQLGISPYLNYNNSLYLLYSLQPMPNGTLLNGNFLSVFALDILNQTMYCFAGTEISITGNQPTSQDQTIGKAKNINFSNPYFCGVDKNNVVYYVGVNSSPNADFSGPSIAFFKIYSKK